MTDAEIYDKYRKRFPQGKLCPVCGQTLSVESFTTNRNIYGEFLQSYCRECNKKILRERHVRVHREKHGLKTPPPLPLPGERVPIPALEVGKAYKITDTGRTWVGVAGGDGNAKPVHFVGPCIARYGANWALRTSTGIRTFTPGQLVGLQVREVERIA